MSQSSHSRNFSSVGSNIEYHDGGSLPDGVEPVALGGEADS